MVIDVNVLTTGWTIAGVIASFLVAVVALGLGIFSLMQTQSMHKKERQRQALERICDWAEMVSYALGRPAKGNLLEEMKSEETMKIQAGMVKTLRILYDAEKLDTTLNNKVKDAVFRLQRYDARLMGKGQITEYKNRYKLEEDIEPIKSHEEMRDSILELLTAFSDVIKSATDKLVPK